MNRPAKEVSDLSEKEAAAWMAKQDAGLSAQEERAFTEWKNARPENESALREYEELWRTISRPRHAGEASAVRREFRHLQGQRRRQHVCFAAGGLACVILALNVVPLGDSGPRPLPEGQTQVAVFAPEIKALPDGSVAELKLGSSIDVQYDATKTERREIQLQRGQAYFKVSSDPLRPFVVSAGEITIRAVGTAFSVGLRDDKVEIIVTEGTVAIATTKPDSPSTPRLVNAGHEATVARAGSNLVSVASMEPGALDQKLSWRNPKVEFSRAPLSEVVAVVNRFNQSQLTLGDPALARVPLSGRFRADDVNALIQVLASSFDIQAEPAADHRLVLRKMKRAN
jgi:transmembrane sensor